MPRKIPLTQTSRRLALSLLILSALLAGCQLPTADSSLKETTMALAIQATLSAVEEAAAAEEAAGAEQAEDPSLQKTEVAAAVQATVAAAQPTPVPTTADPPPEATATTAPTAPPDPPPTQGDSGQPAPGEDFETWMDSANILLYEDIAGVYTTTRFVKEALNTMGLDHVDVKDAVGTYKEQLLSGGPGGQGWDLIISAKEARGLVKGEMYTYLNDALNDGSSVIIEEYELDDIVRGKIAPILSRCGVEFQDDWAWDPLNNQLLWQVDGSLPIHHTPHEGISLTNPTGYWSKDELGDFLRLAPGSDAEALWAARVNVQDTYLTAVSCLDNQLILQTYSTHSYGKDRVVRMWQNYIYHTLLARFQSLQ